MRAVSGSVSGTPHCWVPVPCRGSVRRQGGIGTAQGAQFWGCDNLSALGARGMWCTTSPPPDHWNWGGHLSARGAVGCVGTAPLLCSISGIAKSRRSHMLWSKTSCFTFLAWTIEVQKPVYTGKALNNFHFMLVEIKHASVVWAFVSHHR